MKRLLVLFFLVGSMGMAPLSALGQTVWFKYVGNPVISCGPEGTWDNKMVYPNRVIFQDTSYWMWYTGGDGSFSRTGLAISSDGIHWTKSAQNPVLDVGPGAWDAGAAYEGYVVKADSGYRMWYTGGDGFGNWKLGFASSPDGIVWTKANTANPVIGTGSWYARGPHNPSVLGPDSLGGYKMWFQGNPLAHADVQIGYATATNETTWTVRSDPVFSFGTAGTWDDDKVMNPKIHFDGQHYEMLYAGEDSTGVTDVGYATSPDGLNWTRYSANPVMDRGPLAWDQADLYCLDVHFDGSLYHMWYGGRVNLQALIQNVGYAVSPKGMSISLSTRDSIINSTVDTVQITARVDDPTGLQFSAKIKVKSSGVAVDTVQLFDDGAHGDSLAADGVFSNAWVFPDSNLYSVDFILVLHDTLRFEINSVTELITVVSRDESIVPQEYHLGQNFPNPFNPSTEIRFQISEVRGQKSEVIRVTLKIYDLLGQEVAMLVNEEMNPGNYQVTWDAAGLPSGVYFYRLIAGSFAETKRLILLR